MPSRLSISSSNRQEPTLLAQSIEHLIGLMQNGGFIALLLIIGIEAYLHPYLEKRFFSHEVDWTLRYLKRERNQPVVVLGNSVAYGIFRDWKPERGQIAPLACNQATETAGQFFFLKRFLAKNKMPGAVIICDLTPLQGNLNQVYTENYVQRCFTKWDEIIDLWHTKQDPVFTVKMLTYKALATYKYRLHLQEHLAGFTNSNIGTGIGYQNGTSHLRHGLVALISSFLGSLREQTISAYYFQKILDELAPHNIPLYFLAPPTNPTNQKARQQLNEARRGLETLQANHNNLFILSPETPSLTTQHFRDTLHLNDKGVLLYRQALQAELDRIISESIIRQHSSTSQRPN